MTRREVIDVTHMETCRVRMYPTGRQVGVIERTRHASRFAYNWALERCLVLVDSRQALPSAFDLQHDFTAFKRAEAPWLRDADAQALQQAVREALVTCSTWRANRGVHGRPRFRSRKETRWSYRTYASTRAVYVVDDGHVRLPKVGVVRVRGLRRVDGRLSSATVVHESDGRWSLCLLYRDVMDRELRVVDGVIGIDLGLKSEFATSDGRVAPLPESVRAIDARIDAAHRALARKVPGSGRWERQRARLARLHARRRDVRDDFLHKETSRLVDENQVIGIEDLNVRGLSRNRHVGRFMRLAAFGRVRRQLIYKCAWSGRDLVAVGRWFPSTRRCCACGHERDVALSERTYRCPVCGNVMDRDLNAACNIRDEAVRILGEARP